MGFENRSLEAAICRLLAQGRYGSFIDVGANCGQSLLTLWSVCDFPYLGFEPDLTAATYVRQLIRVNGFARGEVLAVALGSQNYSAVMYGKGSADASAALSLELRPAQMYKVRNLVAVCKGDDHVLAFSEDPIFLIKIDVEGLELEVLKGLQNTLASRRPPVYFEVMGYRHLLDGTYSRAYFGGELSTDEISRLIENRRTNMERLWRFWLEREYRLFRVLEDGLFRPVSTLDERNSPGEMNFLAMPSEAADPC